MGMGMGNIGGGMGGGMGGCGGAGRQQPSDAGMESRMQLMQSMSNEDKQEFRSKMQSMSRDEKMEFRSSILNTDDSKGIEELISMLLRKNESLIGTQINTSA
jgi:hypothetical protein